MNLTSQLNTATFNNCNFGSTTLISNYLNTLEGSLIGFQNYNGGTTSHFWYTNHGKGQSAGSGLPDTTVRTASSLSLVLKPEDATSGFSWTSRIPGNAGTNVFVSGYVYRNATFSSGLLKIELWLPTTSLSSIRLHLSQTDWPHLILIPGLPQAQVPSLTLYLFPLYIPGIELYLLP